MDKLCYLQNKRGTTSLVSLGFVYLFVVSLDERVMFAIEPVVVHPNGGQFDVTVVLVEFGTGLLLDYNLGVIDRV